jgi:predicted alpha/beta hydrolase family esterase
MKTPDAVPVHGLRIARLQAAISLWLLATCAGLLVLAWQLASAAAAWAALLLALSTPLVLGLEMLLASRVHADDPSPRPSLLQRLRALGGEWYWAWRTFLWNQPWRSRRHADPLAPPPRPGVLLVHGYVCNRGFWRPWLAHFERAAVPYATVDLEPPFADIDQYAVRIEAARARLHALTGHPPLIVAHSMGGLAVRAWLRAQGGAQHLPVLARHLVTIGSPHHGTWLARWAHTPNGRQMRRHSPWLQQLRRDEATVPEAAWRHITCVYGHCDNIVFPPSTACLPGANVVHIEAQGHVQMAHARAVRELVDRWLASPP